MSDKVTRAYRTQWVRRVSVGWKDYKLLLKKKTIISYDISVLQ